METVGDGHARPSEYYDTESAPSREQDIASDIAAEPGDDVLATAIGRYVLGEISLGKAAERVELSRWEFEELFEEAGFTALYGPRTADQLAEKVDVALDLE